MSEVRNNQEEERVKEEHDEDVGNAEDKENLESSKENSTKTKDKQTIY